MPVIRGQAAYNLPRDLIASAASSMLSAIGSRLGGQFVGRSSTTASQSFALRALSNSLAQMSSQTPPPDAARGATADLCDTFITNPVDIVNSGNVQIMQPVFRDFGGHLRFKGQAATVKCFENNPLVRKVWQPPQTLMAISRQPLFLTSNNTNTGS